MIKKVVLSYFNPDENFGNRCGYNKFSDFLFTTALSTLCASRHFKEVQCVSSDWGVNLFKELQFPYTSYSNKLNELKEVSRFFWAYGKLLAYSIQDQPFVHIDNDVFIIDPLAPKVLSARLCFQSHEPFALPGYHYYEMLRKCWNMAPVRPKQIVDNEVTDFAYNCGICGGHDLDHFKEWLECSKHYIFAPENQPVFFKKFPELLIHQNLFHEQYFNASLIKQKGLRAKVAVINKDAMKAGDNAKRKYTHLWGTTKRDQGMMARVAMRLMDEDPELFMRIKTFCKKNDI